jgi:ABC-type glutathione transport system ATPase component
VERPAFACMPSPTSGCYHPGMALLEVNQLTKNYVRRSAWTGVRQEKCVVDRVSFSIARGETLGLVGESGSGKSTVARMVLGLVPPTSGTVAFDGEEVICGASSARLRTLRRRMQPVFQDPFAALNPRMTVAQIIAEPFRIHSHDGPEGRSVENPRELLAEVGLDESALPRYPHEFSGGQRQRINIARALALRPDLLLLDEPVSALDVSVGAQIMNLLRYLQQTFHLTYLFISHSMPLVRYLSTNIVVMRAGKVVETGRCEQICHFPSEAYTKALLEATPELPNINVM